MCGYMRNGNLTGITRRTSCRAENDRQMAILFSQPYLPAQCGLRVSSVTEGSIAWEMGILPGMSVISINGQEIEDIFDYRFLCQDEHIDVLIREEDGEETLLEIDKDEGNRKIDERIDKMVEEGLVDEVLSLYQKYPDKSRLFSTIGYQEIIQAVKANKPIDKSVIDTIKIHTHQYAKKQRTLLRHQFDIIKVGKKEEIYKLLQNKLQKY